MSPKYQLGQKVYAVLGGDSPAGIVTGVTVRPDVFVYLVTWQDREETACYDVELTDEPVRNFGD